MNICANGISLLYSSDKLERYCIFEYFIAFFGINNIGIDTNCVMIKWKLLSNTPTKLF